jgi:hypothetical protein
MSTLISKDSPGNNVISDGFIDRVVVGIGSACETWIAPKSITKAKAKLIMIFPLTLFTLFMV